MAGALRLTSPIIGGILGGADTTRPRAVARHTRQLLECSTTAKRRPTAGQAEERRRHA